MFARHVLSSSLRLQRPLTSHSQEFFVLGIETSCDDTGVGIVSNKGRILSDERHSQIQTHLLTGGIVPDVAGQLHKENIKEVVNKAIDNAGVLLSQVRGIAITQGPGLSPSLRVGIDHALKLSKTFQKPIIPVHHMEAHSLVVRLLSPVKFPFLVLLVSGGHCILAICENFGKFFRLGEALDDSPGEAFDKVARMLRLHHHPLGEGLCGGAAIEAVSKLGDPSVYPLTNIMATRLDCNFSFSGIKTHIKRLVSKLDETDSNLSPVSGCENIATSFQTAVCNHLVNRTRRAMIYCQNKWPSITQLVVSGGVASNYYLRQQLEHVASTHKYSIHVPPPSLCTDNGVMIAWTGIEHINAGCSYEIFDSLRYRSRWKLGEDVSADVINSKIKINKKNMRLLLKL